MKESEVFRMSREITNVSLNRYLDAIKNGKDLPANHKECIKMIIDILDKNKKHYQEMGYIYPILDGEKAEIKKEDVEFLLEYCGCGSSFSV